MQTPEYPSAFSQLTIGMTDEQKLDLLRGILKEMADKARELGYDPPREWEDANA